MRFYRIQFHRSIWQSARPVDGFGKWATIHLLCKITTIRLDFSPYNWKIRGSMESADFIVSAMFKWIWLITPLAWVWFLLAQPLFQGHWISFPLNSIQLWIGLSVGTQQIMGATDWEITAGRGILTRSGHFKFDVEFIRGICNISQTLDTRNHPQINDIQLEMGNIQVGHRNSWKVWEKSQFQTDLFFRYEAMARVHSTMSLSCSSMCYRIYCDIKLWMRLNCQSAANCKKISTNSMWNNWSEATCRTLSIWWKHPNNPD